MIFDTGSEVTRSQSLLHAQSSAAPLQMPARSRVAAPKKKNSRYGVAGICLAVALSALAAGTAGLWPFHQDLQRELAPAIDEIKAKLDFLSERVKVIALHRASGNAPRTGTTSEESGHLSAIETELDKFEDLPLTASRNSVQLTPLAPRRNSAPVAQTTRREAESIPVAPKAEIPAPKPAAAPVESVKQVSATAAPAATSQVEIAGMQAAAPVVAKVTPVDTKVAVSPAAATGTVEIIPDLYPSIRLAQDAAKRPSTQGTTLQIGRLLSKVEPVYPAEALRERLAGSVKLHVVIGRNGSVTSAELLDGSVVLAESAVRAVQQWRYEPTLLGGAPVEMEEEIRLVFRISGTQTAAN
jgi:protein TonB